MRSVILTASHSPRLGSRPVELQTVYFAEGTEDPNLSSLIVAQQQQQQQTPLRPAPPTCNSTGRRVGKGQLRGACSGTTTRVAPEESWDLPVHTYMIYYVYPPRAKPCFFVQRSRESSQ